MQETLETLQSRIEELEEETRRLRAAEAKNIERNRLFTAVEQAHDSITVTDETGKIVYVNPAVERATGYERVELLGNNPSVLKSGHQSHSFYRELWETIKSGKVWEGRLVNRRKDGALLYEEGSISPVINDEGKIVHFVAVKHDVTRVVELEEKLALAQKMESLGALAGGIAHELNTPIQFIGDNLKFLEGVFDELKTLLSFFAGSGDVKDLESLRARAEEMDVGELLNEIPEALKDSLDGTQRIGDIVSSMRLYAHPNLEKEEIDLNQVLETTLSLGRCELKHLAEVEMDLDQGLYPIHGNQGQLTQVFLNILTNAAHALEGRASSGQIEIVSRNKVDEVQVQIKDNGTGISPEVLGKIFDPFFTTKDVGKGTGQGLAICSTLVEAHGGSLAASSELGVGTCFEIRFPRLAQA